jgi:NADH:ubiquinone reductase (H+-translocating)
MGKIANIPDSNDPRVVIIGAGFAGLKLARKLHKDKFQVVLLDRYNYHQFQPLLYQVATAGLEPSAISFPLRKIFQHQKHLHFRIAEVKRIDTDKKTIETDIGNLSYDYVVMAIGATTNYFGLQNVEANSLSMKSVPDALFIRNSILQHFESALNYETPEEIQHLLNVVIVGGGPTGVELAGALAEMKKNILPKDYPELDFSIMQIHLYEAGGRILTSLTEKSAAKALGYLKTLGVQVHLNTAVKDYDGQIVQVSDGSTVNSRTLIWAAGVKASTVLGFSVNAYGAANRLIVDEFNRVAGHEDIFAIGDVCQMITEDYPRGHPQVAQVAIQQGRLLAKNLLRLQLKKPLSAFHYIDRGSMATIGRNLAVANIFKTSWHGFTAWAIWSFVHLMSIVGVRNRFIIFINWAWNYVTYDQALRLLIKPKGK